MALAIKMVVIKYVCIKNEGTRREKIINWKKQTEREKASEHKHVALLYLSRKKVHKVVPFEILTHNITYWL